MNCKMEVNMRKFGFKMYCPLLFFVLTLFFPLRSEGTIQGYLWIEKTKYLRDEVVYYEVKIQASGTSPAYFRLTFDEPQLEILDEANHLVPTFGSLLGDGLFPIQRLYKNGRTIIIDAIKLLPGEMYWVMGEGPPELRRATVKPGRYKARFPLWQYDEQSGQFKDISLVSSEFEVVEPTGKDARVDSLLNVVFYPKEQVKFEEARALLRKMTKEYPKEPYAGTILWHELGVFDEEVLLNFISKRPDAMASECAMNHLILRWFNGDWYRLAEGTEFQKKVSGVLAKYKGTKVEQAIQAKISMLKQQPGYKILEKEGFK